MCSSLIYSAQPDLFIAFRERDSAIRQCLGRLETSHFSSSWSLNFLLPFGHCIPPSGGSWDAGAEQFLLIVEFEYFAALRALSSAARRSLGRLCGAQQGGACYGATPPSRPPLHPPRSTPKRNLQLPQYGEGNAAVAPGASFPRYARSGDLPPRRVNARWRICFG